MDVTKILAVCFVAAVLIVLLRQYKSEYGILISAAAGIAVLLILFDSILPAVGRMQELIEKSGASAGYFKTALKALGIAYITGFVADTCRDFGQSSLAAKAELAGKCAIFLLSVPLLCAVLNTALGFAGV